jgi:hypothetical protein
MFKNWFSVQHSTLRHLMSGRQCKGNLKFAGAGSDTRNNRAEARDRDGGAEPGAGDEARACMSAGDGTRVCTSARNDRVEARDGAETGVPLTSPRLGIRCPDIWTARGHCASVLSDADLYSSQCSACWWFLWMHFVFINLWYPTGVLQLAAIPLVIYPELFHRFVSVSFIFRFV